MKFKLRFIKAFYILLLLCVSMFAKAKTATGIGSITGSITDKTTGLPIYGATIFIPDLNIGTSTDEKGNYLLKQLPEGEYLMQVTAIGYASVTKVVNLSNTYSVDFKLSASNYELSDVVVTALGNTTTKKRAPIPISVVTHNMILQGTANTAVDLIARY